MKWGGEYILDARYDADGNISHILNNIVSAVLAVRKEFPNVTVILRAKATAMAQTAFDLLGIPIRCTNANVVGSLVAPMQLGVCPWKEVNEKNFRGNGLYSEFFDGVSFRGYTSQTPERIFISRKGQRGLVNELEVEKYLDRLGFKKVYFEDIPLSLQWSMARNAKAIVGVHGAALFSLVFNRNDVKLVELYHPGYIVKLYRYLVNAVGGTWCGVTGQLPPDIIRRLDYEKKGRYFAFEPARISIESLSMALDQVGMR